MDRSNANGQLMFHLFATFAEFERNLIQERSAAGRVPAKARGRLKANVWINNSGENDLIFESSSYNPSYNSVLTLLTKINI